MHFGDDPRRVTLGLDEPDTDRDQDEPTEPDQKHSS